ncbi:B3 domain-containing transcription factor VRN1 [Linum perenne]
MITSRYPTRRARTMTSASSYANMREIIKLGFSQAQKKSRLSEEYTNFSSITTANDNLALLMVAFCARTESINLRKYHGEHADGRIRILTEFSSYVGEGRKAKIGKKLDAVETIDITGISKEEADYYLSNCLLIWTRTYTCHKQQIEATAAQPPVSPPNNHCYSHMAGLPPIHFCAYITDANRQRRRQRLASEFSNRIDSLVATLQVQTGDTWEVRLHRDISGRLWFTEGWTNFFDFYSVANGYLLVFQYIRNSTLNAAIFSSNSSEIAYPIRGVVNEQAEDHSDLDSE